MRRRDPLLAVGTVALLALSVAACRQGGPEGLPATSEAERSLTPSLFGPVTPTARLTVTPTVAEPTRGPTVPWPTPAVAAGSGTLYEVVFSIPIGQDGVQYRGLDIPDMEITGPNNLAVLPDGAFVLADLIGNRLLWYSPVGELLREVDLSALDILNVSYLRAAGEGLILLEVSFRVAPERYREG